MDVMTVSSGLRAAMPINPPQPPVDVESPDDEKPDDAAAPATTPAVSHHPSAHDIAAVQAQMGIGHADNA